MHCIYCDGLVKRDSVDEAADTILALGEGTRLNVLFPVTSCGARGRRRNETAAKEQARVAKPAAKTHRQSQRPPRLPREALHIETLKARLADLRSGGFNRLWQAGKIFEFSTPESLIDLDFASSALCSSWIGLSSARKIASAS